MDRRTALKPDTPWPEGREPGPVARWFQSWMQSRYAYPVLFLGVLIESTILPWPVEFVLAGMMLEDKRNVLPVTLIAVAGSVIGGLIFYWIGVYLFDSIGQAFIQGLGLEEAFEEKRQRFQDYSWWIIFVAAQTPVPFQITTLAAGVAGVAFWPFFVASVVARSVRYALMAVPVYFFGPAMRRWWRGRPRWLRNVILWTVLAVFVVALVLPFV